MDKEEASHLLENLDWQAATAEMKQAVEFLRAGGATKVWVVGGAWGGEVGPRWCAAKLVAPTTRSTLPPPRAPQVGAVGFCMGGALSVAAAQHAGVDCAAPFYGLPQVLAPGAAATRPTGCLPCLLAGTRPARSPSYPPPARPAHAQPVLAQPENIKVPLLMITGELDEYKGFSAAEVRSSCEPQGAWGDCSGGCEPPTPPYPPTPCLLPPCRRTRSLLTR